jgi:hypothetical protein
MFAVAAFDEVTTGTATKTLVQVLAPSGRGIVIVEVSITFKGVDNLGVPIKVQLLKQTDAGTASALTMTKISRNTLAGDTVASTAQQTFTVEPTGTDIHRQWLIHPQAGVIYNFISEELTVPGGERVGMRVVGTIATAINCVGYIQVKE